MGMVMLVVVVVTMMRAGFRGAFQLAAQKGGGNNFHARSWLAGADGDVVAGEEINRPLTDATGDDCVHAELPQPARKQSGLVRWRGHDGGGKNGLIREINVYQRELPAAAEVVVESSIRDGHGQANCIGAKHNNVNGVELMRFG